MMNKGSFIKRYRTGVFQQRTNRCDVYTTKWIRKLVIRGYTSSYIFTIVLCLEQFWTDYSLYLPKCPTKSSEDDVIHIRNPRYFRVSSLWVSELPTALTGPFFCDLNYWFPPEHRFLSLLWGYFSGSRVLSYQVSGHLPPWYVTPST